MEKTTTRPVSMKHMLTEAKAGGYAIAQININNFQWIRAILEAAQEEQSPIIIAASDRLVDYLGGFQLIVDMVNNVMETLHITVPVALHLDHGQTVERCRQAIDAGFTSVMIDGSHFPIEQNIIWTKEVTNYAKAQNVSVEAEVGTVGGNEDGLISGIQYANLEECDRLVKETGVDALAAALGSVHGPYQGEPKLGFKEMEQISNHVGIPLVLHGGSGIPSYQIKKAILLGHSKINVNTECMQAWAKEVRRVFKYNDSIYDVRTILTPAYSAVKQVVKEKIHEFGSANKV
ncbi:MAG: class II fructose-1,6-bisphosphate aldolase [Solibacillus sp.]